jgi:hypothetical protein
MDIHKPRSPDASSGRLCRVLNFESPRLLGGADEASAPTWFVFDLYSQNTKLSRQNGPSTASNYRLMIERLAEILQLLRT